MEHSSAAGLAERGGREWRGAGAVVLLLAASACVTSRRPIAAFGSRPPRTRVQVFDPTGEPETEAVALGREPVFVGKLRSSPWARPGSRRDERRLQGAREGGGGKAEAEPQGQEQEPLAAEDLYARFGPNLILHRDGRVTKTYYVDSETGKVLDTFLALATGAAPAKEKPSLHKIGKARQKKEGGKESILDALLGDYAIVLQRVPNFDTQAPIQLDPRAFKGVALAAPGGAAAVRNDLVLVTSTPDGLDAFEQAMDLLYRSVPQILIEAKVVEISWGDTLDIGVTQTDSKTPTVRTVGKGGFVKSLVSKFPNTSAPATGAGNIASEGILTIGGIQDNLELNAQLELLQTQVKSDIVSHPKIAVRNGGVAVIDTTTNIPYPEAKIIGNNTQTNIKFAKVGVSMQIRPVVAPGEIVVLQIYASVDAITGFVNTDPIPTPEVSTRKAITSVHVPSGKTTVIGGLITKTQFENESKIPILGDIPLLGYLFRSTFLQKGSSEVVFMITPRIIYGFEGSDPLEEDYTTGGF